jgi:two-component sensor histidine kinase/PAS domain-containing protein
MNPPYKKCWSGFSCWLTLSFALMLLFAATAANLYASHTRQANREEIRLRTQARVVKENVLKNLEAVSTVLEEIGAESKPHSNITDMNAHLVLLTRAMPGVRTLLVVDKQGNVRSSSRPELLGKNVAHRDYFQMARRDPDPKKLFLVPPFKTSLGTFGLPVEKVIIEPNGAFAGLAVATLDPEYFQTLLGSILYGPDMWAAVAHGDGLQFMMVPTREGQEGKNLAQPGSFFSRHRDSGNEIDVLTGVVYATGEERMMAVQSIRAVAVGQDKPLVVAIGRNLDAVYAPWRRDLVTQVSLVCIIAMGSVAGLFFYQRRQKELLATEMAANHSVMAHQRFLKALGNHVPGVAAYWDRKLRCRYASRRYVEWYGNGADQIVGALLGNVIDPELLAMNRPHIEGVLRGESQIFERSFDNPKKGPRHIIVQYIPDRVDSKIEGFFVLITDVTVQRQSQEERLAGVVAQRDALVREVHHRIKNVLQSVTGLLQRQLGRYAELQQPLEQAIAQIMAVASAHGMQGKSEGGLVRLDAMLEEVVGNAREFVDAHYLLDCDIASDAVFRVDKAEAVPLALILNELLRNAVKHGVASADGTAAIAIRLFGNKESATVIVTNGGVPLPSEFDFETGAGLGTGLSLVRSLMPVNGAFLSISYGDGKISAILCLEPPVIALKTPPHACP